MLIFGVLGSVSTRRVKMSLSILRVPRQKKTMIMKARKATTMRMKKNTQQTALVKPSTAISTLVLSRSLELPNLLQQLTLPQTL